jgi:hypothetical protein
LLNAIASSRVLTWTMILFSIAFRAISHRGRARAWVSTASSIAASWDGVTSMVRRTTWESTPCSAWERRSEATKVGFERESAMT